LLLPAEKSNLTTALIKTSLASKPYALFIILALAVAPYFLKLGASSLWDANEAFYAETPREMMQAGDYINPSFNYKPRFNKPPLCYWVVAASYKLFGVSESAERLPLALGAMVMIATAFFLGRAAYSTEAGLIAAIALASTPRFVMFSRRIIIDVFIAMFMGLTLLFFMLAEKYADKRRLFLLLMYASVGLGILTKGPVAAALPTLAFLIYFAATRQLKRIRGEMMLPVGVLIVAAIVLPWYVIIYSQHGWLYIKTFLLQDNLSRYTQPVWGPRRGAFFYLPVIAGDLFPWSLFLFFAVLALAILFINRSFRQAKNKQSQAIANADKETLSQELSAVPQDAQTISQETQSILQTASWFNSATQLLLIWIAVIVIFYSLSSNKEDLYISPVYTAAAAIVGVLLARFVFAETLQKQLRGLTFVIGLLVTALGAAVFFLFGNAAQVYQLSGATTIGLLAIIGGALVITASLMKKDFAAIVALASVFIALNFVFVLQTLPDFERYKPVRALSEIIRADANTDALVGYYRVASPSMVFYLQRQIFEYYKPEELIAAFAAEKKVYCIISSEEYAAIKSSLPAEARILASRPVFQVKLKSILDRRELPQVLLISNN
jgi:4-amino-4-deoxy-L-arabinose transferase-like glycosyltransferase